MTVEEPPRDEHRPDYEPLGTPPELPASWLDPVREGPEHQASLDVFVDVDQIDELTAGLGSSSRRENRWSRNLEDAENCEAVFAWTDRLVFGRVQRQLVQSAYVHSRSRPLVHVNMPAASVVQVAQLAQPPRARAEDDVYGHWIDTALDRSKRLVRVLLVTIHCFCIAVFPVLVTGPPLRISTG